MSYFLICDCKDTTFLQPTNKIKAFLLFYLKKISKKVINRPYFACFELE